MKIAYLLGDDLSKHPGLKHKIDTQIQYWQAVGHEVYRIQHYDGSVIYPDGREHQAVSNKFDDALSKWQRLKRLSTQYQFAAKALREIEPELTYTRYLYPSINVTQISSHAGKLIIEINSDDHAEYLQKSWATGFFNVLFRSRLLNKADGLMFVTNELANKSSFSSYTPNRYVIGNGVEIDTFQFSDNTGNSQPQLVFIGSPGQSWHGLDKIGFLAKKLFEFTFHIIGPEEEACLRLWKQAPANVVFHGYLSNREAQNIIKNMDVGISTLALHRNHMQEACPLKVRQYLAQGLPVIAATTDPDIEGERDFYLQLPNNEQNVLRCLDKIQAFVTRVTGDTKIRYEARRYAEEFLSASKKEAERLKFFEQVLSS